MRKKYKKLITTIAILLGTLVFLFVIGDACVSYSIIKGFKESAEKIRNIPDPYNIPFVETVEGDFVVHVYPEYCRIKGLSEEGLTKRFIYIPEEIGGLPVLSFGAYNPGHKHYFIQHEKFFLFIPDVGETVEKIFFSSPIVVNYYVLNKEGESKVQMFYPEFIDRLNRIIDNSNVHVTYYISKSEWDKANVTYPWTNAANISYYLNDDNPEQSTYFFDNCAYGEKIEYIPENPVREGYSFDGWYKEPECISKWDFETDVLPSEITEPYDNGTTVVYQETALYAKWVRIDSEQNKEK